MLDSILNAFIGGILHGGFYALLALGFTLVFGVLRFINLAHGEFMMVGMYVSFLLFHWAGVDPYWSLFVSVPVVALVSAILYILLIRPVLAHKGETQVILTLGVTLAMSNLALMIFTADLRAIRVPYASSAFYWGQLVVSKTELSSFILVAVLSALLYFLVSSTDVGRQIRATAQDRNAARLLGIDVDRIGFLVFVIGSTLAGAAGTLMTPMFFVQPYIGLPFAFKSFVVVILGGMGSIPGAMLGGILLGLAESLGSFFISTGYQNAFGFAILVIVLIFRPAGILGRPGEVIEFH